MAKNYTLKQMQDHLRLVQKDVAPHGWNARYRKIFTEAARALEELGDTPLTRAQVNEVFAAIYIKPPRKRR